MDFYYQCLINWKHVVTHHILSILIWLPIWVGGISWLVNHRYASYIIILANIVNCLLGLWLIKHFNVDVNCNDWQFVEHYNLFTKMGLCYSLGVDSLSVVLVILCNVIVALSLLFACNHSTNKTNARLMALISILNGLINGVLVATNSLLLYVFFESMLLPLYLIIIVWGGNERGDVANKFYLYNFCASLALLCGIILLANIAGSSGVEPANIFAIKSFYTLRLTMHQELSIFVAFMVAFGIKIGMIPLHTWLPSAHYEAPTIGSVMLAAIIIKLSAFTMVRFWLPVTIQVNYMLSNSIILLALISVIYISLVIFYQQDLKKMIAYSSIINMAIITIALFLIFPFIKSNLLDVAVYSLTGGLMHICSHALLIAGLFFIAGWLADRFQTTRTCDLGGLQCMIPWFGGFYMLFALANLGMPGTFNFISKLFIIIASYKYSVIVAGMLISSLMLALFYTFTMYKNIMFGKLQISSIFMSGNNRLHVRFNEWLVFSSIAVLIILGGVWPTPVVTLLNIFSSQFVKLLARNLLA